MLLVVTALLPITATLCTNLLNKPACQKNISDNGEILVTQGLFTKGISPMQSRYVTLNGKE